MTSQPGRTVSSLDGLWLYKLDPEGTGEHRGFHEESLDRSEWREMTLPANWYRTEVGDYHGVVWFARSLQAEKLDRDSRYFVRFAAVDYICEAWLNGIYLGRHEGFFAPFEFDITHYFHILS